MVRELEGSRRISKEWRKRDAAYTSRAGPSDIEDTKSMTILSFILMQEFPLTSDDP